MADEQNPHALTFREYETLRQLDDRNPPLSISASTAEKLRRLGLIEENSLMVTIKGRICIAQTKFELS